VKQYLAREIIARLPNASAIDLTQVRGPRDGRRGERAARSDYEDLLDELRSDEPEVAKPYEVTLAGAGRTAVGAAGRSPRSARPPAIGRHAARRDAASTSLLEERARPRRVALSSVVPGRAVHGRQGRGCDVVVDGVYASRRHCELWLDKGAWWVTDCGSTNGIRVEAATDGARRQRSSSSAGATAKALPLDAGFARRALGVGQGTAAQYPALRAAGNRRRAAQRRATPVTPIVVGAARARRSSIRRAHGVRATRRSRSRRRAVSHRPLARAIARGRLGHESVSGITRRWAAATRRACAVRVHGDNGVRVQGGAHHAPGSEFAWLDGRDARARARGSGSSPRARSRWPRAS
jgi:hypothetical protein